MMAELTAAQMLELAIHHHQAGRLADAEGLYRQVLLQQPHNAHAIHLLGVLAHQLGNNEAALSLIHQAISINPREADFYSNLAVVLQAQAKTDEAIAALRQAVELRGNNPDLQFRLADALLQSGRAAEAIPLYRDALAAAPQNAPAWNNLGNALMEKRNRGQAILAYRRALELRPDYPEALINLSAALKSDGRVDEAVATLRQSVSLRPNYAEAWFRLGGLHEEAGQFEDAINAYRLGLAREPGRPEIWNNLGNTFQKAAQPDRAIGAYRKAIEHRADYAEAWNNLGNVLQERKQWDEAIAHFRRALDLRPDFPEAWNNLGNALMGQKQLEPAIQAFHTALEQRPEFAGAWYNLSSALNKTGQLDEAIAAVKRSIELQPNNADAHQNLGNLLKDTGRLREAIEAYRRAVELNPGSPAESCLLLSLLYSHEYTPPQVWEEHVKWDRRIRSPLASQIGPHANDRSPGRRLRIGYVSGDFRHHVVAYNMIPLFREHDRESFEIVCYSNTEEPDEFTAQFRSRADHWREIRGVSDDRVAQWVREDRIDILVDLALHTGGNRLPVFAHKPAPVQVAFAGYPWTTGLSTMDYRLTDPYLDPPEADQRYSSEQPVRLPDAFWCYDPLDTRPPVAPLPATQNGYVTFGCLNNFCKVNEPVLKLWSRVLLQVPRSRLLLLAPRGSHRDGTLRFLEGLGIEASRVELVQPAPRVQYLRYYGRIDIGLDTFPYNGHTTSLDSYFMGVPVVTLIGNTPLSRAGWCQLSNLNLRELAAESEEQFVSIATGLARNLPRLAEIRSTLRDRLAASPLMDAKRFARNIEAAYRQMWGAWCRSGNPNVS